MYKNFEGVAHGYQTDIPTMARHVRNKSGASKMYANANQTSTGYHKEIDAMK